jgi:hypothetical protein
VGSRVAVAVLVCVEVANAVAVALVIGVAIGAGGGTVPQACKLKLTKLNIIATRTMRIIAIGHP